MKKKILLAFLLLSWYQAASSNIPITDSASITLDTTAPTIDITGPTSSSRYATTSSTIAIYGTSSDATSGVQSITYSLNSGSSLAATGTTSWSVANISLQSGANTIVVTAIDASGNTATDTITVTYTVYVQEFSMGQVWQAVPLRTAAQKVASLTGGEGMQMIFGIAYAPSNPQTVYLVNDTSFVWKSIDGGKTWAPKHKGALAKGGVSIAVDPNNENAVFVAGSLQSAGRPFDSNTTADGIYRSVDGGENWLLVRKTPFYRLSEAKRGTNFAFSGTGVICAGTYAEGILKSTDGGSTWISLGSLPGVGNGLGNEVMDIKIDPQNSSVLFAATRSGLYKITDAGAVSAQVVKLGSGLPLDIDTDTNPNNDNFPRAVAIDPGNPSVLIVSNGRSGVYKSTDGGATFVVKNTGITQLSQSASAITTALAMSPVNSKKLYVSLYGAGGRNIYYSDDGADNWFQPTSIDLEDLLSDLTDNNDQGTFLSTSIVAHPTLESVALARGAGTNAVLKTTTGGTSWSYSGNGYTGGAFGGIGWDYYDPNKFIIFLIDFGPMLTLDGGVTFKRLSVPRYNAITTPAGALEPTQIYANQVIVSAVGGWSNQILIISRDGGSTWTQISGTDDDYDDAIYFHPGDPNIIYAGRYKSTDKGLNWIALSKKVIAVYPRNGDTVYSAEYDSVTSRTTTVYKSIDGGQTWSAPYGTFSGNYHELKVSTDSNNQEIIYAAVSGGVNIWNSTSGRWELKNAANGLVLDRFGSINVYSLAVDPNHTSVVYAGKFGAGMGYSNGIFRSQDYGQTWENITYDLGPELNIWHLDVSPHDGYVYLGTPQGTWKFPPPYTLISDTTPPTVIISSPTTSATYSTTTSTLNLSGSASDETGGSGLKEVTWSSDKGGSGTAALTDSSWSVSGISSQEGPNTITVTATDNSNNSSTDTLTVTYTAPTPGTVAFLQAAYSRSESYTSATITVTRTGGSDGAASVQYSTADATAAAGSDYTLSSGTLNWTDGASGNRTFTIPITADTIDEVNETVNLTLTNPTGATLGTLSSAVFTINDNDNPPTAAFTSASQSKAENTGATAVTIQLSSESGREITVPFSLSGTATGEGADYSITPSPLTIPIGQTSADISVILINDTTYESQDETLIITLGTPTNVTLGTTTTHTLTITDDDAAPDTIAPIIAITGPTSEADYSTTSNTLSLSGNSSDNIGVTSVTWSLDQGGSGTAALTNNTWTISNISLASGQNNITVTATDSSANTSSDTLTVTCTVFASGMTFYVDPSTLGNDNNSGSLSSPWKTLGSSVGKLSAGDTLYLRGGIYYESNVSIAILGSESNHITIKNYPNETPVIDGGYQDFRAVPNSDWELYDNQRNIYRSIRTYPGAGQNGTIKAFLKSGEVTTSLISYERYDDLASDNQLYVETGSMYLGPGAFWNSLDQMIYIRLVPSDLETQMGYQIPSNQDPKQNSIYLVPVGRVVRFENNASYLDIEGISFQYRNNALHFASGHHISVRNITVFGGTTYILTEAAAHDLTFDNITVDGHFPPWLAFKDIKSATRPAHAMEVSAFVVHSSENVTIVNSTISNVMDAIGGGGNNFYIHHNNFFEIRDDVLQLNTNSNNVNMAYNRAINCSKSFDRDEAANAVNLGTKLRPSQYY